MQFDVFLGYDGIVPEASWFPIVIEVDNDGPTFTGLVEITGGNLNESQPVRLAVELPSGTLKRLTIPLFATTFGMGTWDVRLFDDRGKVRAEQTGLRPRRQTAMDVPLLGALSRSSSGTLALRQVLPQDSELQPESARLLPAIFPDNPLVLEGMSSLYLNSAKAADLSVTQIKALLAWLHAGGHLIVGVEQISEITAAPWLADLFPCTLKDMREVPRHTELQDWLTSASGFTNLVYLPNNGPAPLRRRNGMTGQSFPGMRPGPSEPVVIDKNPFGSLPEDIAFETNALQAAVGSLRDGRVVVAAEETPLILTARRGRGELSVLLFSPEREPFRSWKNQPTFWAKLIEVPSLWYATKEINKPGGWSSDAVFGAMIDTRQVHKLPVEWLLVLLIVYLVVIGPLDQMWLKRIGRPMLTWITFPCYVVLFSLLIYFIGYKLRAGESEWNEVNVVDVLPHGDSAELRGRTYASIYSPVNQKYLLESQQPYATLRGEFAGTWNAGQSSERATVWQIGDSFRAEIFVPVWTSQLFVSDWWQPADVPLAVSVAPQGEGWRVTVENHTDRKLTNMKFVRDGFVADLDEIPVQGSKTFNVAKDQGTPLPDFVRQRGKGFQEAVQARSSTFGASHGGHLDDLPNCTTAVSFISQLGHVDNQQAYEKFMAPPGLDLSSVVEHGYAVVLAWAGDYSPVKSMCQFSPRRNHRDTLWRVAVPIMSPKPKV